MKIEIATFERLLEAFSVNDHSPRSYSGRGMYGKECLGVECSSPTAAILDIVQTLVENMEVETVERALISKHDVGYLVDLLREHRTDSLGCVSILYFPRIDWIDVENLYATESERPETNHEDVEE